MDITPTPEQIEAGKYLESCKVTLETLAYIIFEQKPIGIFFSKEGTEYIVVDNTQGEAIVHSFLVKKEFNEFMEQYVR